MNIFCIEQNYFAHKLPHRNLVDNALSIFVKPGTALFHDRQFNYPGFASELYCGCELVLHICQNGRNIKENEADNYYDRISAGVNFTALQNHPGLKEDELSWADVKAWDNSSVTGKWIPAAGFKNKADINFCLYKNRELMLLGNSGLMVNNFGTIISGISRSFDIYAGDIVFTGSPAATGELAVGDKLEAFIEDDSLLEFEIEL
jgi:2-keto-4-pentenoate hydratase/2-oxohepta-3-ene-1,7-dioic acid hydratase in catechol pathway